MKKIITLIFVLLFSGFPIVAIAASTESEVDTLYKVYTGIITHTDVTHAKNAGTKYVVSFIVPEKEELSGTQAVADTTYAKMSVGDTIFVCVWDNYVCISLPNTADNAVANV